MYQDPLLTSARGWLAQKRRAAVVQVLKHEGSVPRESGTRMLVADDGGVLGSVGGGELEWQAIAQARAWLRSGQSSPPAPQRLPLGPTLGQCCGGAVTLGLVLLDAAALLDWPAAPPLFCLQLYGAGHVGQAVAKLLAALPCEVQWIDEREEAFATDALERLPGLPAHIERICVAAVQSEVRQAPPGAFYLVLTHSHALDLAITKEILQRDDIGFFGLIGSATKRARFCSRLRERGISDEKLAQIHCPIGVPGIRGKAPEVIAVAVVAQLLQEAGRAKQPQAWNVATSTLPPHSTSSTRS